MVFLFGIFAFRFIYKLFSSVYHQSTILKDIKIEKFNEIFVISAKSEVWCKEFASLNRDKILSEREDEKIHETPKFNAEKNEVKKKAKYSLLFLFTGMFLPFIPMIFSIMNRVIAEIFLSLGFIFMIIGAGLMISMVFSNLKMDNIREEQYLGKNT